MAGPSVRGVPKLWLYGLQAVTGKRVASRMRVHASTSATAPAFGTQWFGRGPAAAVRRDAAADDADAFSGDGNVGAPRPVGVNAFARASRQSAALRADSDARSAASPVPAAAAAAAAVAAPAAAPPSFAAVAARIGGGVLPPAPRVPGPASVIAAAAAAAAAAVAAMPAGAGRGTGRGRGNGAAPAARARGRGARGARARGARGARGRGALA